MQLGEVIIESTALPIWKCIVNSGIGVTGLVINLLIQRFVDNYYWDTTTSNWISTIPVTPIVMIEVDNTNNPGLYTWNTNTPGFLGEGTRTGFRVNFKSTSIINLSQNYYSALEIPTVVDPSIYELQDNRNIKTILGIVSKTGSNIKVNYS